MAQWKYRGVGRGKKRTKRGRKKKCVKPKTYTTGVARNTVVPGGKLPRSIVTTKIGSGEFTRRVPI